jgi:putative ABC transport system permease protein
MGLLHLVLREIRFRWLSFGLGVLSVTAAAGCLAAAVAMLREHQYLTDRIVAEKEQETQKRLALYEDEVRKLTKDMGFNVLILPKDVDLGQLYVNEYADKYMPEAYAERLVKSGAVTINHILPSLQQRMKWPERERTVMVMGIRGEVWVKAKGQKPILEPVPKGMIWLGFELHRSLKINRGDTIAIAKREFTVTKCLPERGSKDDISIWMSLPEAQELLGRPGQINAILALECNCTTVDRLGEIRTELTKILPDTQVIEYQSQALARAEARNRAAALAREAVARERENRESLARAKETLAAVVVPLVLVACAVWIGFLSLANVRERRIEIGVLRALGVRTAQILVLFLSRAMLAGLLGAGLGYAAGLLFALNWTPGETMVRAVLDMARPAWIVPVLACAPLLAACASWLPALAAARQDPAGALRDV